MRCCVADRPVLRVKRTWSDIHDNYSPWTECQKSVFVYLFLESYETAETWFQKRFIINNAQTIQNVWMEKRWNGICFKCWQINDKWKSLCTRVLYNNIIRRLFICCFVCALHERTRALYYMYIYTYTYARLQPSILHNVRDDFVVVVFITSLSINLETYMISVVIFFLSGKSLASFTRHDLYSNPMNISPAQ